MKIKIVYRIDTSEYFETDTNIINVESWDEVLSEIKSIEGAMCTVIEITNLDLTW